MSKNKTFPQHLGVLFLQRRHTLLLLWGVFCSVCVSANAQTAAWQLEREKDSITVSSRHRDEEKTKEFRVEMKSSYAVADFVRIIKEASLGTQWIHRAVRFETLETLNERTWYTYTEISIPWPFANKDLITHNTLLENTKEHNVTIRMVNQPTFRPQIEGISRLEHSEAQWRFETLPSGETLVAYEVFARSSGGLPAWLVNPIIVQGLYATLRDLRTVVATQKKIEHENLSH